MTELAQAKARALCAYAQRPSGKAEVFCKEPTQLYLGDLGPLDHTRPINVSKAIHRSPFRYPGGKTWLVPYVRQWMSSREAKPSRFIEPFAGGAICSLTSAFEHWVDYTVLAELDDRVASVWKTTLGGQAEWLARKILAFELTPENVRRALARDNMPRASLRERAFTTILRNRVQRGGIMAPGAGLVKNGENGRGLGSRWYPETLARRIRDIASIDNQIAFIHGDGLETIKKFRAEASAVFFVDPPYTKAAKRLYGHWELDHEELFSLISTVRGDFMMTYDNTDEIKRLANAFGFKCAAIAMKNTHHSKMTELLIGKNLSWLDLKA